MFLSSRQSEKIFGKFYLEPGQMNEFFLGGGLTQPETAGLVTKLARLVF
jgi:hypothetical protein